MGNMSSVTIVYFIDGRGHSPVEKWLDGLPDKARDKCYAKLEMLEEYGPEIGMPTVKPLRDKIFEVRAQSFGNQYRILFTVCTGRIALLAHAILKKTREVPNKDIDIALKRKAIYEKSLKKRRSNRSQNHAEREESKKER